MDNEIESLLKETSTFTTQDAQAKGITKRQLHIAVDSGQISRVQRGVYIEVDDIADPFVEIQGQQPKGIFSLDTALGLYDMSDTMFHEFHVTFPKGYHLREKHDFPLIAHYAKAELYEADHQRVRTIRGNFVTAFSPERSLVDAWRFKIGGNLEINALSQYLSGEWRDLYKLHEVMNRIGHSSRLEKALEVLINA